MPSTEQLDILNLERFTAFRIGQDMIEVQFLSRAAQSELDPKSWTAR